MERDQDSIIIEMRDVTVASTIAPSMPMIENVNWSVATGDYWVIGGLPGSGKTDLLTTAAGLLRPLRGSHWLFGTELGHASEEEMVEARLRVGFVFTGDGRLFRHMTVAENLALPLRYHKNWTPAEAEERVNTILDFLGLKSIGSEFPSSIPRTLRQRVALARALTLDPEVLLLDDPLRGMDPRQQRWWLEFMKSLCAGHEFFKKSKMTLVVTGDDLRPLMQQAGKFAVIKDHRWILLGEHHELDQEKKGLLRELVED